MKWHLISHCWFNLPLNIIIFLCGPFFKVFIEFVTILLLFYVLGFFGPKPCGILAPGPGIEPALPALEPEVLTTGPPGESFFDN